MKTFEKVLDFAKNTLYVFCLILVIGLVIGNCRGFFEKMDTKTQGQIELDKEFREIKKAISKPRSFVNRNDVEIKSLRIAISPSGNWVDTTFLIKNNSNRHIRYVLVELAGWDKKKNGDLMISNNYMSDPIPPKDWRAVTFPVRYVRGATHWTARAVKIKYKSEAL